MPSMSTLRMTEVTYDARDAGRLARFWAEVLGWDVGPGASEYVANVGGPRRPPESLPMLFVQVPEEQLGEYYAQRTLLKREVLPEHCANAVFALVGPNMTHTTGLHIPVDAGVAAAFLR